MDILSLARMVATRHSWGVVPAADGGCRIEVRTEAMRTQVVQLSPGQDPDGRPILWVWSVICETSGVGDPLVPVAPERDVDRRLGRGARSQRHYGRDAGAAEPAAA